MNTMWKGFHNMGDFARSVFLGKVVRGDVIRLDVELE